MKYFCLRNKKNKEYYCNLVPQLAQNLALPSALVPHCEQKFAAGAEFPEDADCG